MAPFLTFLFFFVLIQTLREDLREQKGSRDYINKTGNDLISKAPSSEKAVRLEADLKIVTKKWNTVSSAMETRINEVEAAVERLREYEVTEVFNPFTLTDSF